MTPYDPSLTPYQNSFEYNARNNENKWNEQGGNYPSGTLGYHFPQPGPKTIKVSDTKVWRSDKRGYISDQNLETNGYSYVDYKAQNAREFGFIDYGAHGNLKLDFIFNNVYGK